MQEKSELESRIPENLYFGGGVGAVVGGFRGLCGAGDWFRSWRVGVLRREVSANLRGWKCHVGPAKGRMACGGRRLLVFRKSPCQNTVLVHVCFWPPHRPIRFFGTSSVADNAGLQNHAIRTSIGIHRSNAVTQQFLLCLAFRRQRSGDWCVRGASSDCLCGCETRGRIQTDAPATSLTPPFLQVCCASASSGGEIDAHAVPTGPVGKTRQTLRLLSMSVSGRLPGEELCGDSSSGDV